MFTLYPKILFSSQITEIHFIKCMLFPGSEIEILFWELWMENEDYREPWVRYGKAKAIVVLLDYPPKVLGELPRVMGMNETDLILPYENDFLDWNTYFIKDSSGK